jgi:phosphoglycolate phosphatase-like HAD superfamily hydrolase
LQEYGSCLIDLGLICIYYVNMNLKLAFFDIDGTLIWRKRDDGISLKSASFNYALNKVFGLNNVSYLLVLGKRLYGMTDKLILKTTLEELGYGEGQYYANEGRLFKAADEYFERNLNKIKEFQYDPNPGVREFLDLLKKRNTRLGLVTGNIKKHSDWKMRGVNFHKYFSTGAYGEDGMDRAEIMSVALERNDDIPLSAVCHFGDSPLDLSAAAKLGVRCVALTHKGGGTHSREELETIGYGLIIDSWKDLDKIETYLN